MVIKDINSIVNLTLTNVVFEFLSFFLKFFFPFNLTLTNVVFECLASSIDEA